MRRVAMLLLLAALLVAGSRAEAHEKVGEIFRKVNSAVVTILARERDVTAEDRDPAAAVSTLGSGVLISGDGKVVTAAHVVQAADEVTVEFESGESVTSRVVASEPAADVALLQLASVPVRAAVATLGDSERVDIGDQVLVVGAPYGLSRTATVGHIGARRRPSTIYGDLSLAEFFQTDAAINKGNSGGPMFNLAGEIVGIVSYLVSKSGGSEGLGFAVTSNTVRRLLLERSPLWSGFTGQVLSDDLVRVFNVPQAAALLVERVAQGSAAEAMGLRGGFLRATIGERSVVVGGDIILGVDGISLATLEGYERVQGRLSRIRPGDVLTVNVLRAGQRLILTHRHE